MSVSKPEPVPFHLENVMGQPKFLQFKSASIHLMVRDFLEISDTHISVFQKGEMNLELNQQDTKPNEKK